MQIDPLFSTLFNQHQPEEKQCLPQGNAVCIQCVEINMSWNISQLMVEELQYLITSEDFSYCISQGGNEGQ